MRFRAVKATAAAVIISAAKAKPCCRPKPNILTLEPENRRRQSARLLKANASPMTP